MKETDEAARALDTKMRALFPDAIRSDVDNAEYLSPPSWEELVRALGFEVLVTYRTDDYQGDLLAFLRDGARIGFVSFGYGSCSGCDALEGCRDVSELGQIYERTFNNIHWEPNLTSFEAWFNAHDWEASYLKEEDVRETFAKAKAEIKKARAKRSR